MVEFASSPFFLPLMAWLGATAVLLAAWLWMQHVHDRREREEYGLAPPERSRRRRTRPRRPA
jgi:hypothetical protein